MELTNEMRRYPFRPAEVIRLKADIEGYEKGLQQLKQMLEELF